MNLSENFTLQELTICRPGFDNTPSTEVIKNLKNLCAKVLQPLRDGIGLSIEVAAGYRCINYNAAVGGDPNSEHIYGLAADIHIKPLSNQEIINWCIKLKLPYHQIIDEQLWRIGKLQQWIHISWSAKPSLIIKTARNVNEPGSKTKYNIIRKGY